MSLTVRTNVPALAAQRSLSQSTQMLSQSLERLSSGRRINSAKDDAAGLQIANRLSTQIRGIDVAVRNGNDSLSIMQTAEGGMKETTAILQRMRDLALQSSNGANSALEREALQQEAAALNDELNRIAETTSFGGNRLLNGGFGTSSFQIGAAAGEAIAIRMPNMRSDAFGMSALYYVSGNALAPDWQVDDSNNDLTLQWQDADGNTESLSLTLAAGDDIEEVATYINGHSDAVSASVDEDGHLQLVRADGLSQGAVAISGSFATQLGGLSQQVVDVSQIDLSTVGGSQAAIGVLDGALKYVDGERAYLGAHQNRVEHALNNLTQTQENLSASHSRIIDTDYAKETTAMLKQQILQQVSTSVLAQAKQSPNLVLSLLG